MYWCFMRFSIFLFFNDTATTEIYTLSLHDALPIWHRQAAGGHHVVAAADRLAALGQHRPRRRGVVPGRRCHPGLERSEEHTSELQSRQYLLCRLLLEKKNI